MAQVVQAACPGCKKPLRMPADWLQQPMKCKHCGTTFIAKDAKRAATAPVATPASPFAQLNVPSQPVNPNGSPFADIDAVPTYRRRRRSRGSWTGPLLALVVLGAACVGISMYWPKIAGLFAKPGEKQTANADKEEDAAADNDAPKKAEIPTKAVTATGRKSDNGVTGKKAGSDLPTLTGPFPRRALLISVDNYLFMNPVNYGVPNRSVTELKNRLSYNLKFPMTQITELSDAARTGTHAPVKPVIEQSVTEFLAGSRAQDRVLIYFAGHAVEIDDQGYLVPIEADPSEKGSLIPVAWFYKQLEECKARQKVLILDVCRLNPAQGVERPGSGPLGKKFDEQMQKPPAGVQLWTACVADQFSYEDSSNNTSFFLEKLLDALPAGKGNIQRPDDSLPLESLVEGVNRGLNSESQRRNKPQVSRLAGKEAEGGTAYDPKEEPPPRLEIKRPKLPEGGAAGRTVVEGILNELDLPPVKKAYGSRLRPDSMPPFAAKALEPFTPSAEESKLKNVCQKVKNLLNEVAAAKEDLQEEFLAPANEMVFKADIVKRERDVAKVIYRLGEAWEEMEKANKEDRDEEPSKRWKLHFDYLRARLAAQIAYIYEYQSMLGQLRKELPPRDANLHNGWRLASQEKLQGDKAGKDMAKEARKIWDKIIEKYPGTPWELLAKRDRLTTLGLEWQAVRIGGER